MTIITDTREQLPIAPHRKHKVLKKALSYGDYTTTLLHSKYHIERKSPQDLYSTLTKGNRRFKKEIWRAWEASATLEVYVECTKRDFINKNFKRGDLLRFPSEGLKRMILTFETRYELVFVWCGSRKKLEKMIVKKLEQEERKTKPSKS